MGSKKWQLLSVAMLVGAMVCFLASSVSAACGGGSCGSKGGSCSGSSCSASTADNDDAIVQSLQKQVQGLKKQLTEVRQKKQIEQAIVADENRSAVQTVKDIQSMSNSSIVKIGRANPQPDQDPSNSMRIVPVRLSLADLKTPTITEDEVSQPAPRSAVIPKPRANVGWSR